MDTIVVTGTGIIRRRGPAGTRLTLSELRLNIEKKNDVELGDGTFTLQVCHNLQQRICFEKIMTNNAQRILPRE